MTVYEQLMSLASQVNPESRTVNTGTTTATAADLAKIREEHAAAAAEKQRQAIYEYADAGRGRTSGARLSYVDKRIASGKIPNHTTTSQLHHNNAINADFEEVQAKMEEYSNLMKAVDYANAIVKEASNGQYQNVKGTIAKATVDARTAEQEAARVSEWLDRNYGIKTNGTRIDASGFYGTFFGNQMEAAKKAASEAPIDTIAMLTGQDVNYLDASTTDLFKSASEDDLQLYKYLLEQDKANGTNRAETFKTFLQDNLAQKRGAVIAQNAEERDKGPVRSLMYGSQALAGGASAALNNLRDTITGEQGARSASEYSSEILRQGLAEEGRDTAAFFFDAAQSVGAMAPGLVAGTISPALGAVIFGTTSGASSYQDKLDEGWSQSDAAAYGVLSGLAESTLQYALGGIGYLGGVSELAKKAVSRISKPALRAFAGAGIRGGSEFIEEFTMTYLEPAIEAAVSGTEYDKPEVREAIRNGLLGLVSSLALGGGEFVGDVRDAKAENAAKRKAEADEVKWQNEIVHKRNENLRPDQRPSPVDTIEALTGVAPDGATRISDAILGAQTLGEVVAATNSKGDMSKASAKVRSDASMLAELEQTVGRKLNSDSDVKTAISELKARDAIQQKISQAVATRSEANIEFALDEIARNTRGLGILNKYFGMIPGTEEGNIEYARQIASTTTSAETATKAAPVQSDEAEQARNIIDEIAGIAPVAEQATESAVNKRELQGAQEIPAAEQKAEQAASERLNQQENTEDALPFIFGNDSIKEISTGGNSDVHFDGNNQNQPSDSGGREKSGADGYNQEEQRQPRSRVSKAAIKENYRSGARLIQPGEYSEANKNTASIATRLGAKDFGIFDISNARNFPGGKGRSTVDNATGETYTSIAKGGDPGVSSEGQVCAHECVHDAIARSKWKNVLAFGDEFALNHSEAERARRWFKQEHGEMYAEEMYGKGYYDLTQEQSEVIDAKIYEELFCDLAAHINRAFDGADIAALSKEVESILESNGVFPKGTFGKEYDQMIADSILLAKKEWSSAEISTGAATDQAISSEPTKNSSAYGANDKKGSVLASKFDGDDWSVAKRKLLMFVDSFRKELETSGIPESAIADGADILNAIKKRDFVGDASSFGVDNRRYLSKYFFPEIVNNLGVYGTPIEREYYRKNLEALADYLNSNQIKLPAPQTESIADGSASESTSSKGNDVVFDADHATTTDDAELTALQMDEEREAANELRAKQREEAAQEDRRSIEQLLRDAEASLTLGANKVVDEPSISANEKEAPAADQKPKGRIVWQDEAPSGQSEAKAAPVRSPSDLPVSERAVERRDRSVSDVELATALVSDKMSINSSGEYAQRQREAELEAQRQREQQNAPKYDIVHEYGENAANKLSEIGQRLGNLVTKQTVYRMDDEGNKVSKRVSRLSDRSGILSSASEVARGNLSLIEFATQYRSLDGGADAYLYSNEIAEAFDAAALDVSSANNNEYRQVAQDKKAADVTKAFQMLAHRAEQAAELKTTNLEFSTQIRDSKTRSSKTALNWYFGGQSSPDTMFKALGGFDSENGGQAYKIADKALSCNATTKRERSEGYNFFTKVTKHKDFKEFARNKLMSGYKVSGHELTAQEAVSLLHSIRSLKSQTDNYIDGIPTRIVIERNGESVSLFETTGERKKDVPKLRDLEADIEASVTGVAKEYSDALNEMFSYYKPKFMNAISETTGVEREAADYGKYFPLFYNGSGGATFNIEEAMHSQFERLGFAKERVGPGETLRIVPAAQIADNYIEQVSHYIGWSKFSSDLNMLSHNIDGAGSFLSAVSNTYSETAADMVTQYIKDVGGYKSTDSEKGLKTLISNFAGAVITGRPSVALSQLSSVCAAGGIIKPAAVLQSGVVFPVQRKNVNLDDGLLTDRARHGINDSTISEITRNADSKISAIADKVPLVKGYLNMVGKADAYATKQLYAACWCDVNMDYPDLQKSNPKLFDTLVSDKFAEALLFSQSDADKINNAAVYRSNSALFKAVSMFTGQPNKQLNMVITALGEYNAASQNTKKAAGKKLANVLSGQISAALSYSVLKTIANAILHKWYDLGDGDDEDEDNLNEIGAQIFGTTISTVSGMGLFGELASNKIMDKITNGKLGNDFDMQLNGLSQIFGLASNLLDMTKVLRGEAPTVKEIKDLALNVADVTGAPVRGAYDLVNALSLWGVDVYNKVNGIERQNNYDITKVIDSSIELSEANQEQRRLLQNLGMGGVYVGKSYKNAPSEIEYDDSEFKLTKQERKAYQEDALEASQAVIDELVNSALYKNATDEQKAGMMKSAVSYGKDVAKKSFVESKGLEYESDWDDERVLEDLPGYLAFKAMTKEAYGSKDETPDYDAIDALLGKHYGELSEEAQELIVESYSKIDDLYEAKKLGIDSETWYGYKAEYDKLKARVDASVERTKAIEAATGVDAKVPYNWDDAAKDFAVYIEKHAKSPKQAALVRDQLTYWQQISGNTETYDKLRELGLSPDSASHTVDLLGSLKPQDGNKTVVQRQKHEAIAFDETLTDSEKFAALIKVTNANSPKRIANIEYCRDNGISPEDCYWKYLAN